MGNTLRGVPYIDLADPADIAAGTQEMADWINDNPGIKAVTTVQRDAFTAAEKWTGRVIWNVTAAEHQKYNGAAWSAVSTPGVTDHGDLTGLADDDHGQYYNAARHTKAVHDALGIVPGDATVATAKVIDDAVTYAKLQNVSAASRILGRGSAAGAGDAQELTVGAGLSIVGTVLSASETTFATVCKYRYLGG